MLIAALERGLLCSGCKDDVEFCIFVVFASAESDSIRQSPCPAPTPFFPEVLEKLLQHGGKLLPVWKAKHAKICLEFFLSHYP